MTDHTRTEKIGGDSIYFYGHPSGNGKPLWQWVLGETVTFEKIKRFLTLIGRGIRIFDKGIRVSLRNFETLGLLEKDLNPQ